MTDPKPYCLVAATEAQARAVGERIVAAEHPGKTVDEVFEIVVNKWTPRGDVYKFDMAVLQVNELSLRDIDTIARRLNDERAAMDRRITEMIVADLTREPKPAAAPEAESVPPDQWALTAAAQEAISHGMPEVIGSPKLRQILDDTQAFIARTRPGVAHSARLDRPRTGRKNV